MHHYLSLITLQWHVEVKLAFWVKMLRLCSPQQLIFLCALKELARSQHGHGVILTELGHSMGRGSFLLS